MKVQQHPLAGDQDQNRGQRLAPEGPAAAKPAGEAAGDRDRLSDSIIGLFDRLRQAAETHDDD